MKKLMVCIATALMLVTFTPIQTRAEMKSTLVLSTDKESAKVKALINRVNEINAMDRSTMSRAERKALRKELRTIKKEVHRHSSGVYVSWGIIVLILVLIIVL